MSQIEIKISSFSNSINFQIKELKSSYNIAMMIFDEIIDNETFDNQQHEIFEKIYQKIKNKESEQLKDLVKQLNQLSEKHLRYKTLSLQFNKNDFPNYHLQFQSICKYKPESYEEQERDRTRAILDGYYVDLKTTLDSHRIHSPDKNSHPNLISFIRSTTNLLKEKFPIDFQDKRIINI